MVRRTIVGQLANLGVHYLWHSTSAIGKNHGPVATTIYWHLKVNVRNGLPHGTSAERCRDLGAGVRNIVLDFLQHESCNSGLTTFSIPRAYVCKRSSLSLKAEGCTLPEGPSIAYNKLWNRRPVEYEVWQRAAAASAAPAAAAAAAEAWTALGGQATVVMIASTSAYWSLSTAH